MKNNATTLVVVTLLVVGTSATTSAQDSSGRLPSAELTIIAGGVTSFVDGNDTGEPSFTNYDAGAAIGVNLNTDIEKGVFDRFRSLPIARSAPLVGSVLADILRYSLLCVVTVGFGYVLGFRATTSVPEVLAACLLGIGFALCLCWISVYVGMIARTPGAVQGLLMLGLFPLTFGSTTAIQTSRT